jgi:hypothetical protein
MFDKSLVCVLPQHPPHKPVLRLTCVNPPEPRDSDVKNPEKTQNANLYCSLTKAKNHDSGIAVKQGNKNRQKILMHGNTRNVRIMKG